MLRHQPVTRLAEADRYRSRRQQRRRPRVAASASRSPAPATSASSRPLRRARVSRWSIARSSVNDANLGHTTGLSGTATRTVNVHRGSEPVESTFRDACPRPCPNERRGEPAPKTREPRCSEGSRMARPGLEPGTPRFSVAGPSRANVAAMQREREGPLRSRVSKLSRAFRTITGHSGTGSRTCARIAPPTAGSQKDRPAIAVKHYRA